MFVNAGFSRKRAQLRSSNSAREEYARTSISDRTPFGYESSQSFFISAPQETRRR